MYTISIFITSTPQKKYLYYQHNGLVVVTTACVEVLMAPRLFFRISTKLRDGATAANLSLTFKSVTFHAYHAVANVAPSIDFFSYVMVDASLSLGNTMMATIDPALPADRVAITGITFSSSPRSPTASHDPLHNYPAPPSMKMQYIS
ncbi:LOW QUALITY PROTEIN: hypothetical protein CFC21_083457 [Triticum aestivum]|uniref:Legume lectin domain-containing protein n=2 Tax=Triticum aestivum TaxID=4565 RepID=A0A9R1I9H7_WHEAT|nr:LOW QUALITY PROTEIN: hypothetical protein CFC21_083457 [Triticum aestivum]